MTNPVGALTPEDEGFNHQVIDTFAVVGSTDLAWTEKVCAMAMLQPNTMTQRPDINQNVIPFTPGGMQPQPMQDFRLRHTSELQWRGSFSTPS